MIAVAPPRVRTSRPLCFSRPALASLIQHKWPGNIRELENVVRSVALFTDSDIIGLAELAELGELFSPPDEQALLDLSAFHEAGYIPEDSEPSAIRTPPTPIQVPTDGPAPMPSAQLSDAWFELMIEKTGGIAALKKHIEFEAISRAITSSQGNISQAAKELGMKRPRLSQIIHADEMLSELKRKVSSK